MCITLQLFVYMQAKHALAILHRIATHHVADRIASVIQRGQIVDWHKLTECSRWWRVNASSIVGEDRSITLTIEYRVDRAKIGFNAGRSKIVSYCSQRAPASGRFNLRRIPFVSSAQLANTLSSNATIAPTVTSPTAWNICRSTFQSETEKSFIGIPEPGLASAFVSFYLTNHYQMITRIDALVYTH